MLVIDSIFYNDLYKIDSLSQKLRDKKKYLLSHVLLE